MDKDQLQQCLNLVVQAERDLQDAKDIYKDMTESAFDALDLTKNQQKAMKKVAKAMLKNKVKAVDNEASELTAILELVLVGAE